MKLLTKVDTITVGMRESEVNGEKMMDREKIRVVDLAKC